MSADNKVVILAGLAVAYLYMRRKQAVTYAPVTSTGAPTSMPANVGSGLQQVKVGAIAGLLQSLASGPWNNTSTTVIPMSAPYTSYGAVQDVVNEPANLSDMLDANADTEWWA